MQSKLCKETFNLVQLYRSAAASAAEAVTVTAYSEEDYEGDDNEPNDFILKKITEAVHIYVLSFYYFQRAFSLSNIIICERVKCVKAHMSSIFQGRSTTVIPCPIASISTENISLDAIFRLEVFTQG